MTAPFTQKRLFRLQLQADPLFAHTRTVCTIYRYELTQIAIYYSESPAARKDRRNIPLASITGIYTGINQGGKGTPRFMINIQTAARTYHQYAETDQLQAVWTTAIQNAAAELGMQLQVACMDPSFTDDGEDTGAAAVGDSDSEDELDLDPELRPTGGGDEADSEGRQRAGSRARLPTGEGSSSSSSSSAEQAAVAAPGLLQVADKAGWMQRVSKKWKPKGSPKQGRKTKVRHSYSLLFVVCCLLLNGVVWGGGGVFLLLLFFSCFAGWLV